jgi:hypothetical protein
MDAQKGDTLTYSGSVNQGVWDLKIMTGPDWYNMRQGNSFSTIYEKSILGKFSYSFVAPEATEYNFALTSIESSSVIYDFTVNQIAWYMTPMMYGGIALILVGITFVSLNFYASKKQSEPLPPPPP